MDEVLRMERPGWEKDVFRQAWVEVLSMSIVTSREVCAPVMVHTITIKRSRFFQLPPTTGYCNSKRKHKYPGIWHTLENGQVRETEHSREADMEVTLFCMESPHQSAQLGQ